MNYETKVKIHERAKKIVASNLDWEDKYDMIFSDEISARFNFYWYDPDTSYQEDVESFMRGFDEYMEKQAMVN